MDHMLAVVTINGVSGLEIAYIQRDLDILNCTRDKCVIHIGERKMIFAEVITDWDWKDGSMDHYMKYLAHTLVGRYRSMTRVEKSAEVPFTRTCYFETFEEASEPITYTIEYRTYDREYITDDILEELKNETK